MVVEFDLDAGKFDEDIYLRFMQERYDKFQRMKDLAREEWEFFRHPVLVRRGRNAELDQMVSLPSEEKAFREALTEVPDGIEQSLFERVSLLSQFEKEMKEYNLDPSGMIYVMQELPMVGANPQMAPNDFVMQWRGRLSAYENPHEVVDGMIRSSNIPVEQYAYVSLALNSLRLDESPLHFVVGTDYSGLKNTGFLDKVQHLWSPSLLIYADQNFEEIEPQSGGSHNLHPFNEKLYRAHNITAGLRAKAIIYSGES